MTRLHSKAQPLPEAEEFGPGHMVGDQRPTSTPSALLNETWGQEAGGRGGLQLAGPGGGRGEPLLLSQACSWLGVGRLGPRRAGSDGLSSSVLGGAPGEDGAFSSSLGPFMV